jgi:hypothetical protein
VFGVHFGQPDQIDDDGGRIGGAICPPIGSPYPVVQFSRHQYERALAMACDLDWPAASVSQKRFDLASKLQNRLARGHQSIGNAGRGVTSSEAWPAQSEAMLATRGKSVHITNAGVSGDTNAGMLSRLDSAVPDGIKFVLLDRFGGGWNARRLGKGSQTARFEARLGLTNNIKPGRTSEEGGPACSAKSLSLDSAYATCERTRNQSIRKIMGSTSSITIKKTKNGCGGPTWK